MALRRRQAAPESSGQHEARDDENRVLPTDGLKDDAGWAGSRQCVS
jgi:hypothetical protein